MIKKLTLLSTEKTLIIVYNLGFKSINEIEFFATHYLS